LLPSCFSFFFLHRSVPHPHLHSFPTRRSSDLISLFCIVGNLIPEISVLFEDCLCVVVHLALFFLRRQRKALLSCLPASYILPVQDRKSTRLNSSHVSISYAVFCLKKKTDTYVP